MPKGPPVHEIFNPPIPGSKAAPSFNYEKKESKTQLTHKKTLAPLPPMTKFGGYKPKILGGGMNEDIVPISSHKQTRSPEPPVAGVENNRRPPVQLTQPKPFIIGDKNTPMVLSTVDHDDSDSDSTSGDLQDGIEEIHIYEEPPMYMASSDANNAEMNNNNNNNNDLNNNIYNTNIVSENFGGMVNNKSYYHMEENFERSNSTSHHPYPTSDNGGAFIVQHEHDNLISENHTTDPTAFATENPAFHTTDTLPLRSDADDGHDDSRNGVVEHESEPDGVFIPAPDYDEEERVMEFDDEDPDEMAEEEKKVEVQRLQRLQHLKEQQNGTRMKVYDGEDLSKYLSDDEDDFYMDSANSSKTMPARLNQKHSLFKTTPQHPTINKRKNANKKHAQKFNSVRNFSLADSKYATAGKVGGKKMMVTGGGGGGGRGGGGGGGGGGEGDSGEYESFLSMSQQGEGYETFLVSKHGVGGDSPSSGHPGYRPSHHSNGKTGDGIWKKLTVRLKHKKQKNGYDMQEQF